MGENKLRPHEALQGKGGSWSTIRQLSASPSSQRVQVDATRLPESSELAEREGGWHAVVDADAGSSHSSTESGGALGGVEARRLRRLGPVKHLDVPRRLLPGKAGAAASGVVDGSFDFTV